MKRFRIYASILTCLLIFTGCGKPQQAPVSSSDDVPSFDGLLSSDDSLPLDGSLSSDDSLPLDGSLSPNESLSPDGSLSSDDSLSSDESSPEELARAAYSSLLSGDTSLLDDEQLRKWGLEGWFDFLQYEYTYLDLDKDGIDELLIQLENDPYSCNAVFHYADGKLFCWNVDMVEMTSGDYPLQGGTMVSQYNYNGTRSYTIFRYLSDGKREVLSTLFAREELIPEDSDAPCPYYEIDGTEVDQSEFEKQLKELITDQLLERSVWTIL